jgi:RNA polymerase sigma-70 factor, ECF subfamily
MNKSELDFQEIYDTFQPKIHRYLTRLAGAHEAEDLTQEVFVKVRQGLRNFRGKSQLSTWIYRIATNAGLDRLRSSSYQRTVQESLSNDSVIEDEIGIEDKDVWTGEKTPTVEQELIRKEMNECIRNFIEKLPENYRTILVLGELEGLKNHEIAEILRVSLDTVKIRLHRARAKLREELQTHCSFYHDERNELACDLKITFKEFRKAH